MGVYRYPDPSCGVFWVLVLPGSVASWFGASGFPGLSTVRSKSFSDGRRCLKA